MLAEGIHLKAALEKMLWENGNAGCCPALAGVLCSGLEDEMPK